MSGKIVRPPAKPSSSSSIFTSEIDNYAGLSEKQIESWKFIEEMCEDELTDIVERDDTSDYVGLMMNIIKNVDDLNVKLVILDEFKNFARKNHLEEFIMKIDEWRKLIVPGVTILNIYEYIAKRNCMVALSLLAQRVLLAIETYSDDTKALVACKEYYQQEYYNATDNNYAALYACAFCLGAISEIGHSDGSDVLRYYYKLSACEDKYISQHIENYYRDRQLHLQVALLWYVENEKEKTIQHLELWFKSLSLCGSLFKNKKEEVEFASIDIDALYLGKVAPPVLKALSRGVKR